MDKLSDFWDKYKGYCLIAVGLLVVGLYYLHGTTEKPFANPTPSSQAVMATGSSSSAMPNQSQNGVVAVDVKGAVKKPGVYELKSDSRINEALTAAGGALPTADLRQVNLAKQLTDQQMIYVPTQGEQVTDPTASMAADAGTGTAADTATPHVNLNTATKEQLCQINGIGDKKADLILQYRQEHGQFKSIDELKEINGFGEKTVAKLKEYLAV